MRPFSTSLLPSHNFAQPLYLASDLYDSVLGAFEHRHWLDIAIFFPTATTISASLARTTAYPTWNKFQHSSRARFDLQKSTRHQHRGRRYQTLPFIAAYRAAATAHSVKAIFYSAVHWPDLWGRSGERSNSNSFLRRCERSRLIAHISGQVHEGFRLFFLVHYHLMLRLTVFGMMRVDRMFKRVRIKGIIGRGKVIWGIQGALSRGYINGRTSLDQGGHGVSKASGEHTVS